MALLLAYAVANWWRAARPVAHLGPGIEGLEDAIRARAESLLREIKFQQSFTQGWSGSIKLPAGFEVGSQESTTLAERQQSFPEIVDRLRRFIVEITATHRVVIGIDEMDKIASNEDAQRFLNDIKGIFGIPHCFYLVSISEDAMSSFERRGLPFRDAFDSSFDEVVHVTFFTLEDTKRFLEGRIVGLGLAFASLCHCVAGGLARDVIRVARDIAAHAQAPEPERRIDTVCRSLVRAELAGKCDAVTLSARSLAVEPALSDFVRWAKGLHALRLDAEPLLEHCGRYPESLRRGGPEPDSSEARDRAKLRSLATELVGFAYFAATLLDFFDDSLDRSKLEECRRGDDEQKRLDALAEARQLFAINASVAWERVSAFRRAWGVRTVEFPPQPRVPAAAHDGAGAELDAGVSSRP